MPIILAQAAAPPAAVAPAPPRPSVITQPDWAAKPSGQDMAEYYPKEAARNRVEGSAILSCDIDAAGTLVNCASSNETPPGAGFGAAVLSLAGKFKMRPMTKDGVPVSGGHVRIPIRFVLPKETIPNINLAMRCYGYAAAEAERNPASGSAQAGAFVFGMLIQAGMVAEHPRPSEIAEVLLSQRRIAAAKIDDPASKPDRDECAAALPASAVADLQKMSAEVPK